MTASCSRHLAGPPAPACDRSVRTHCNRGVGALTSELETAGASIFPAGNAATRPARVGDGEGEPGAETCGLDPLSAAGFDGTGFATAGAGGQSRPVLSLALRPKLSLRDAPWLVRLRGGGGDAGVGAVGEDAGVVSSSVGNDSDGDDGPVELKGEEEASQAADQGGTLGGKGAGDAGDHEMLVDQKVVPTFPEEEGVMGDGDGVSGVVGGEDDDDEEVLADRNGIFAANGDHGGAMGAEGATYGKVELGGRAGMSGIGNANEYDSDPNEYDSGVLDGQDDDDGQGWDEDEFEYGDGDLEGERGEADARMGGGVKSPARMQYEEFLRQLSSKMSSKLDTEQRGQRAMAETQAMVGNATIDRACSVFAMQGRRDYMEDAFAIHFPPRSEVRLAADADDALGRCEEPALFGVFDGHGGSRVSEYAAKHLLARVNQLISGRTDLAQPQPDAPTTTAASPAGTPPRTPAAAQDGPDAVSDTPSKASGARAGGGVSACGVGGGGGATSVGVKSVSRAWMKRALDFGFSCTDREVMNEGWMDGSTSVVMAVTSRYIMVANAGDSRAVLMDGDKAVPLSCDHKPSRPDEMKRIEKSGGFVMHLGVPRVNGVLAVSRALGDAELKHLVPSQPEYRTLSRSPRHRFAALASDGVWDVMANQEVMDMIAEHWGEADHGARMVATEAYNRGSFDNICCMVLDLSAGAPGIAPVREGPRESTSSSFDADDAPIDESAAGESSSLETLSEMGSQSSDKSEDTKLDRFAYSLNGSGFTPGAGTSRPSSMYSQRPGGIVGGFGAGTMGRGARWEPEWEGESEDEKVDDDDGREEMDGGEESEGGVAKEDSNDDGGGMDGMDKTVDGKEVQDQQEEDEEEEEERSSEVVLA